MKLRLAVALSFIAVFVAAPSVRAADAPKRSAYNWTGFYIGAQIGYGWAKSSTTETNLVGTFPVYYNFDADGALGGGHVGYNYQFDRIVAGLEGDFEVANVNGSQISPAYGVNYTSRTQMDYDGSLRLRAGYSFDRLLVYGTGGLAYGRVRTDYGCEGCVVLASGLSAIDGDRWGWTIGAGVDYAATDKISVNLEYRYTDLGAMTKIAPSPVVAIFGDDKFTSSAVRLGASYHF